MMILEHLTNRPLEGSAEDMALKPRVSDQHALNKINHAIMGMLKVSQEGSIDQRTRTLVKIRSSQLNGCAYCLSMHHRDALKEGERPDRLATVDAWWECDWFTPRERAALAWTEAVTLISQHQISDELFDECRKVYSEQEMIDLTAGILEINMWNRMAVAFTSRPDTWDLDTVKE